MSNFDPTPYQPRNPVTHARIKRESRWQIIVPVIAVAVILLVIWIVAWLQLSAGEASTWADISIIWLIIPSLFFAFLAMVVMGALTYLTIKLIIILPYQFYRLLNLLLRINLAVRRASDKIVAPFIRINMLGASARSLRGRRRQTRGGYR